MSESSRLGVPHPPSREPGTCGVRIHDAICSATAVSLCFIFGVLSFDST